MRCRTLLSSCLTLGILRPKSMTILVAKDRNTVSGALTANTPLRKSKRLSNVYTFGLLQIQNGEDVNIVSKRYGIPRRNLLRWKKFGCERKEGGGRPTDDEMERIIHAKIK